MMEKYQKNNVIIYIKNILEWRSRMIDFTRCPINKFKYYVVEKNGGKICITYNGEDYMLKFPAINQSIEETRIFK